MKINRSSIMKNTRVRLANLMLVASIALPLFPAFSHAGEQLSIDVYRDANCGCCKSWVKHMQANGFEVHDHVETNMSAVKERLGVTPNLASCHTAVVNGKFVEGHVPAEQVKELAKRSDLAGMAVPGMVVGSPGMEYEAQQQPYQVLGLTQQGTELIVAQYPQK